LTYVLALSFKLLKNSYIIYYQERFSHDVMIPTVRPTTTITHWVIDGVIRKLYVYFNMKVRVGSIWRNSFHFFKVCIHNNNNYLRINAALETNWRMKFVIRWERE